MSQRARELKSVLRRAMHAIEEARAHLLRTSGALTAQEVLERLLAIPVVSPISTADIWRRAALKGLAGWIEQQITERAER